MKKKPLIVTIFLLLLIIGLLVGCEQNNNKTPVNFSSKSAHDVIEQNNIEEWTYVVIGDSVLQDFPYKFKDALEKDLGVKVNVKVWVEGGGHSSDLLYRIKNNEALRDDLKNADIITLEIPWHAFSLPAQLLVGGFEDKIDGLTPEEKLKEAADIYQSDTNDILAAIVSLSAPSKTLIRTMDTYQFGVDLSKDAGCFHIINTYWRECNQNVIKTAAQYNIPTVRVYDAFMGEDGETDPKTLGLLKDVSHPTEKGVQLMVELFRDVGYHYAAD